MDDFYTEDDYNLYDPSYDIDNAIDDQYLDPDNIYIDPYEGGQDPSAGGDGETGTDPLLDPLGGSQSPTVVKVDGKYYDTSGRLVFDPKDDSGGLLGSISKFVGKDTFDKLKKLFVNDKGEVNLAGLAGIAGGIYGLMGGNTPQTGGYKGTIPKYEAVRRSITQPEYKPYSGEPAMGRRYFSDVAYVPKTDTAGIAAAEENAAKQIAELEKYVPRIAQPEKKKDKTESKGITSILTPEQLIAKERGIVAGKNVPAGDVMSEVKRLNPQLDWSKYDPNKMTMDVDDYTRAINNYYASKGFTPPSRNQKSKDLEKSDKSDTWYFADDGTWVPNEEIHLDPAERMINQPAPQLSDAIDLLKSGGSKEDATKILRQIVGLDQPTVTPPASNLSPGTYLNPTSGRLTVVPDAGGVKEKASPDPTFGFTRDPDAIGTMALVDWRNPKTGETYTAPDGAYQPPNADWVRDTGDNDMSGGIMDPASNTMSSATPTTTSNTGGGFFRRRLASRNAAPTTLAEGGIAMLAKGRYLRGSTDGMADKIPSSIDNKQPAKLSHGEFVIPADVVSHLGNGNSDAGADVLYKMMDRVRKARTGTKKQGKQINPAKFTPGGIASYAGGGAVAFNNGGAASTGVTGNATTETSLAPWAGDAVTDYIGRGTALAKEAYIPYQGALTAGVSPLQQQGFDKAAGLGGTFDSAAASQYMNPYIQNALQPQLNELRRQADISQQALSGKFAGAGALGGARDAIARSEGIRNLLSQQSGVIGGAYKDAYDKAMQQYNTSRTQDINDINAIMSAGQTQRGIEEDKIKADRAAFEEERLDPYQKIKFEQSLFTGLPLSSTSTTPNLSPLQQIGAAGKDITQLYDLINKWLGTKP